MHASRSRLIGAALSLLLAATLAGCSTAESRALAQPAGAPGRVPATSGDHRGAAADAGLTDDDGYIPEGSSLPLDSDKPAVTRLSPNLLSALRHAQAAMKQDGDGTDITIADGWRSERYQEHLFAEAVRQYGSEDEAEKWVKRGADSAHVRGDAVDIADAGAMDFLNRFGDEWGLCQVYANEAWHFELRTTPGGGCPAQSPDGRG
ncbi:M15 family metallopeptidase [Leifsonia virtsii]|uniref:M15 family metallopeptidase n=1 Tax=Leifsonia virtsii TaxID=3035915 RepID=A0ABT8IW46_9MICO|nr:M15 family metallopeptidase [Leifsonia virtsii]MDN4597042.1 M15 family metallopeptidase [Leifsonia virtsii]